jgi:hypothetical protein
MESVIAFGRINGTPGFQYGPKTFDKDWSRTFKALSIANVVQKFVTEHSLLSLEHAAENAREVITNKYTEPPDFDVAEVAQAVKAEELLQSAEVLCLDLDYLSISKETNHLMRASSVNAQTILFSSSQGRRPTELLADALEELGLEGWGYMRQIVLALAQFEVRTEGRDGIHRSMNLFFRG